MNSLTTERLKESIIELDRIVGGSVNVLNLPRSRKELERIYNDLELKLKEKLEI